MVRKKLTWEDRRDLAEASAWREHGKRNASLIVGLAYARMLAPFVFIALAVGLPIWLIVRTFTGGSSSSPVSAGPWPIVLSVVSALVGFVLWVYRWANPHKSGAAQIVGIVVCFLLTVLAILWARAVY